MKLCGHLLLMQLKCNLSNFLFLFVTRKGDQAARNIYLRVNFLILYWLLANNPCYLSYSVFVVNINQTGCRGLYYTKTTIMDIEHLLYFLVVIFLFCGLHFFISHADDAKAEGIHYYNFKDYKPITWFFFILYYTIALLAACCAARIKVTISQIATDYEATSTYTL